MFSFFLGCLILPCLLSSHLCVSILYPFLQHSSNVNFSMITSLILLPQFLPNNGFEPLLLNLSQSILIVVCFYMQYPSLDLQAFEPRVQRSSWPQTSFSLPSHFRWESNYSLSSCHLFLNPFQVLKKTEQSLIILI